MEREYEVVLDQPRRLRYGWRSLGRFEEATGVRVADVAFNFHTILHLVWAGMLHENPKLTVDDVAGWLDTFVANGGEFQTVVDGIIEALKRSGFIKTDARLAAKANGADHSGETDAPDELRTSSAS